jgi:hypothetical protein
MSDEIAHPSSEQVDYYLNQWTNLPNYVMQESSLSKLFHKTYPYNVDIDDVLIKVCALNDFYSTHILSPYSVAQHILDLKIDDRLQNGDARLVNEIARNEIKGKSWNFYSFATKYCSHHKAEDYPIFDYYVQATLTHFKKQDRFAPFTQEEMKDYPTFKDIILQFREYYKLAKYDLKQLDRYLWLLGKKHFK